MRFQASHRPLPAQQTLLAGLLLLFSCLGIDGADDTYSDEERQHWSLRAPVPPAVPVFANPHEAAWPAGPADAFILKRLAQSNLKPAPQANRLALIRRVTFSLSGLPPTPEQIEEFTRDRAPDAYERLVDRLLA